MTTVELPEGEAAATLVAQLDALIAEPRFEIHFQPIVQVQRIGILGFEALTRGPADSPLHSPLVLFDLAARHDRLIVLEQVLVRLIVRRFVELGLPGQLFVNVTADTLSRVSERREAIARDFEATGLSAARVVVELTETRPILDLTALRDSLVALREMGFRVALDDLGEGFAGLRRWSELRPDFVKIDRHFIDGVAGDPLKQQFVRSIAEMAVSSGATVVAEGLEDEGDLRMLARLGISVCQGYLLGRPTAQPRPTLRADLPALLDRNRLQPGGGEPSWGADLNAGQLARRGQTVSPAVSCREAIRRFQGDAQLYALPVLDAEERPIGVLRSMQVFRRGSERYFDELFGRRSCTHMMDPSPLVFDVSATLRQMSEALTNQDDRLMGDGFVVTQDGRYFGVGRSSDLVKAVSDLQVQTARHANPLTGLPGNIPIEMHLDALLRGERSFTVVHWDLSSFKAYNDEYGFSAGDELIRLTADVIRGGSDALTDFVGHIGGDDFVQVLMAADWEPQVQQVTRAFDLRLDQLVHPEHLAAGGYPGVDRRGQPVFHPLPSLRGGLLVVLPGDFPGARALATAMAGARKQSKKLPGRSGWFVERRRLGELKA
jgi:EAL domain-containing protein (putative c-di-GMP-specific phosphodiesterase class I)/GGDEF domain-containing protein